MTPRVGAVAARAAVALLAVAVALVAAEIILRVTGLAAPGGVATVTEREFRRVPGVYAPRQNVVSRDNPALPHQVTIDSLGYRGSDFPRHRPDGELRVLFTGDSFTYGSFVDDSVTVPALVEAALRRDCGNVRVVNAGLGGSTITDQARLVGRALALEPDMVVVMFSENDVTDLRQEPMWERLAANRQRKSRFPASLVYGALRRTALWNIALRSKARWEISRSEPAAAEGAKAEDAADAPDIPRLRAHYVEALAALRDSLGRRPLPLVFAAIPTHLTLSGTRTDEQIRWVLGVADSLGLPRADILTAMEKSGRGSAELYLLPHDGHTSPAGNHIAAAAIADVLRSQPVLLTVCPSPGGS